MIFEVLKNSKGIETLPMSHTLQGNKGGLIKGGRVKFSHNSFGENQKNVGQPSISVISLYKWLGSLYVQNHLCLPTIYL